jgi:hypothetical protein
LLPHFLAGREPSLGIPWPCMVEFHKASCTYKGCGEEARIRLKFNSRRQMQASREMIVEVCASSSSKGIALCPAWLLLQIAAVAVQILVTTAISVARPPLKPFFS